jgi:hypothetical protein
MDNGGFVMAAYVITAALVGTYTWRLLRRLGQARLAGKQRGA